MSEMDVTDNPGAERYEITVDGKLAGFVEYTVGDGVVALTHTEVDDAFAGQGVGGRLAQGTLDDLRRRGLRVSPICPFIKGYIEKHADYRDLVAS
jgi:predicted GNAT family acetyltransferase